MLYLLKEVGGFELTQKNNCGNTVLHLAIKSENWKIVKLLFIKEINENIYDLLEVCSIKDIVGNLNEKCLKNLQSVNNKHMNPLFCAVV